MEKEDIKYLSNTLENYYYLKRKEKEYDQEIILLQKKIEEERIVVQGMQYECNGVAGSGCSVTASKPKLTNRLVAKQLQYSVKRDECIRKYNSLDMENRITERLKKLKTESQIIINNIFQRGLTINDVANLENLTKQTISNRLKRALEEMLRL